MKIIDFSHAQSVIQNATVVVEKSVLTSEYGQAVLGAINKEALTLAAMKKVDEAAKKACEAKVLFGERHGHQRPLFAVVTWGVKCQIQ
jgi:hypothetical protein